MSEGSTPARGLDRNCGRTTAPPAQSSWIATARVGSHDPLASSASQRSTAGSGPRKAASIFFTAAAPSMNFHTLTLACGKAASELALQALDEAGDVLEVLDIDQELAIGRVGVRAVGEHEAQRALADEARHMTHTRRRAHLALGLGDHGAVVWMSVPCGGLGRRRTAAAPNRA